ncbi:hypothetical protein OAA60_05795 [Porticoccaceae bacterium]|jgi:hypothetical protein|nr:hypothetical protein [Porticoccaceae bacterium]
MAEFALGYNTSYICTYHENETGNKNEDTELYQRDMWGIFLSHNGQVLSTDQRITEINKALEIVYEHIGNNIHLIPIFEKTISNLQMTDLQLGLIVLYSYDTLHLIHPIISRLLIDANSEISPDEIKAISDAIDVNLSSTF